MFTYLITAFSFLAANFGWFGGMPQTEIFFWTEVIISVAIVLAIISGGRAAWACPAGESPTGRTSKTEKHAELQ